MWMSLGRIHGNKKMHKYAITQKNKWRAMKHLWGDHTTTRSTHVAKSIYMYENAKNFLQTMFLFGEDYVMILNVNEHNEKSLIHVNFKFFNQIVPSN